MPDEGMRDRLYGPLIDLYGSTVTSLLTLNEMNWQDIPEPERLLLVHRCDMTSTLAKFHGSNIRLHVLQKVETPVILLREVILHRMADNLPVEYGAIRIYLSRFPPAAQDVLRAGTIPLGTVLSTFSLDYVSEPFAYLKSSDSPFINKMLELTHDPTVLYGRRNRHLNANGELLADILEIVPPGL